MTKVKATPEAESVTRAPMDLLRTRIPPLRLQPDRRRGAIAHELRGVPRIAAWRPHTPHARPELRRNRQGCTSDISAGDREHRWAAQVLHRDERRVPARNFVHQKILVLHRLHRAPAKLLLRRP